MKKRIFSMALALVLSLSLAVPALAAEEPEPEYRLTKVVNTQGTEYTFAYGQGGYLPTEVLQNGAPYVTVSYDEDGRITAFQNYYTPEHSSGTFAYDEDGNCSQMEATYDFGDGPVTYVTEYAYDEVGNRIREDETGTGSDTHVTEYTYDKDGNCVREEYIRTGSDGAKSTEVTEYTYDDEGRMLSKVTADDSGESSETSYTYSEDGRCTTTNGTETKTSYETPLVYGYWEDSTYTFDDGTSISTNEFYVFLEDDADSVIFLQTGCTCNGEPTLTYDDNGYLVRVDGAEGNYIELTYEPVV